VVKDFRLTPSTEVPYNPERLVLVGLVWPHGNPGNRGCSCLTPTNILQFISVSNTPHGGSWEWPQRAPQRSQQQLRQRRPRRLQLHLLHQSQPRRRLVPPSQPRRRPELRRLLKPQPQRSLLPRESSLTGTFQNRTFETAEFLKWAQPFSFLPFTKPVECTDSPVRHSPHAPD
jgi:hypothetical protein